MKGFAFESLGHKQARFLKACGVLNEAFGAK